MHPVAAMPSCSALALALALALSLSFLLAAQAQDYEFPAGFYFSSATASYQVEGAWNLSGKGENVWDHMTHYHPELIIDGSNGDVACDSYHKYKEDVQLVKSMGMNMYRFSLSWSRILPTGAIDNINPDGLRYYNDLINELTENKIIPVVTLFHWDLPQPLMDIGGMPNEVLADYFEDFAEVAFREFGDRVKFWITMNEPSLLCNFGYGTGSLAPAIKSEGVADYLCVRTVLLAHARAYRLYDKKFRSTQNDALFGKALTTALRHTGQVGISYHAMFYSPKDPNSSEDINAAERALQWNLGFHAHPVFSAEGDFPEQVKQGAAARSAEEQLHRSRMPAFTAAEIATIRGSADFFGLNHYTSREATYLRSGEPYTYTRSMASDGNYSLSFNDAWPKTGYPNMREVPWGFRRILQWIVKQYGDIPILITENGRADAGELKDVKRTAFFRQYLKSLLEAIHIDKINVIGYTAWSLMDNMQWNSGYRYPFGLYRVDFNDPNRPRTAKMSVKFFQEVIRTRKVPETDPDFPDDAETTAADSSTPAPEPTATTSRPSGGAGSAGSAGQAGILAAVLAGAHPVTGWLLVAGYF